MNFHELETDGLTLAKWAIVLFVGLYIFGQVVSAIAPKPTAPALPWTAVQLESDGIPELL